MDFGSFTWVDAVLGGIALISGILAYSRGFTRELFAIGAWIVAAVAAFYLSPKLEPLLREIPAVGEFLAESCVISVAVAFALIMAVSLLILAIFTPLMSSAILDSSLGPLDRALGFLFGVARGILLASIAWLIYTQAILGEGEPELDAVATAQTRKVFVEPAIYIRDAVFPETGETQNAVMAWFEERTEALIAPCEGTVPEPSVPEGGGAGTGTGGDASGTGTGTGTGTGGTWSGGGASPQPTPAN